MMSSVMTVTLAKFTVEEYHCLIATGALAGRSVELLEGLIVEMAPEGPEHSETIRESANWFRSQLGEQVKVSETHPITLPQSEPEPDIALVVNQRYREQHPTAQDIFLIIEVAYSSLEKDLNEKMKAYANANISEYWLIDLLNHRVMVMCQPEGDRYQINEEYTSGTICPLQFPNLNVSVDFLLGN
jgi:Uma2 family endonuclease